MTSTTESQTTFNEGKESLTATHGPAFDGEKAVYPKISLSLDSDSSASDTEIPINYNHTKLSKIRKFSGQPNPKSNKKGLVSPVKSDLYVRQNQKHKDLIRNQQREFKSQRQSGENYDRHVNRICLDVFLNLHDVMFKGIQNPRFCPDPELLQAIGLDPMYFVFNDFFIFDVRHNDYYTAAKRAEGLNLYVARINPRANQYKERMSRDQYTSRQLHSEGRFNELAILIKSMENDLQMILNHWMIEAQVGTSFEEGRFVKTYAQANLGIGTHRFRPDKEIDLGIDTDEETEESSIATEDIDPFTMAKGIYKEYRNGAVDKTAYILRGATANIVESVNELREIVTDSKVTENLKIIKETLSGYKTEELASFSQKISESLDKVGDLIEKLPIQEVKEISAYIKTMLDTTMKSEKEGFTDTKEASKTTNYLFYLTLIAFTGCATMAVRDRGIVYIILSVVLGGVLLYYFDVTGFVQKYQNTKHMIEYLNYFINMFSNWGQTGPQFNDGDVDMACASIGTLFSFYILKDTPYSKMAGEIYNKVSNWERFQGNLSAVIKNVIEMVNKIYNAVLDIACEKGDESARYSRWLKSSNPEIEDFVSRSQDFCDRFYTGKLHYTKTNQTTLKNLIKSGQDLLLRLNRGKSGHAPMVMQQLFTQLIKINEKYSKHNFDTMGTRQEPVWLMFIGAAGNGKSIVSRKITHYVVAHLLPDETARQLYVNDCDQYFFYRKAGMEYWEGHTSAVLAIIYDDLLQAPDSLQGKVSEPLEIIHCKNTEPLILNMAFGEKGYEYFVAKLITSSSNTLHPVFETITHRQAYFRRCRNAYIVVPKPEYRMREYQKCQFDKSESYMNWKVDYSKLPLDEEGESVLDETCVDFIRIHYSDDGKVSYGATVDYHQVVKETLLDINNKEAQFRKHSAELKRERERGVYDYMVQAGLIDEEITTQAQGDTSPEFTFETAKYEQWLPDYSCLPPSDYVTAKPPETFTKIDFDRISEMVNTCKDTTNIPAFRFYLIALHFYRKWNDWSVSSNVAMEEVVWSYYTRYGDEFYDLYVSKDSVGLEKLCVRLVGNGPKFDRRFVNVVFPHHPLAYWHQVKKYVRNWKGHIYEKYIRGTWIEALKEVIGWAYSSNPYYFKFMGVVMLLNVISSMYNKYVALPAIQKLIDANDTQVQQTQEIVDNIKEATVKKEWEALAISKLNDALARLKTETSGNHSKILIDSLISDILEDSEHTDAEKLYMIRVLHEQVVTETTGHSATVKPRQKTKGKKLKLKEFNKRDTTESQGNYGIDPNGDEIVTSIVNNNCYEFMIRNSPDIDRHTKIGTITFLKYNYVGILKHFVNAIIYNMLKWDDRGLDYLEELVVLRQCGSNKKVIHKCKLKDFINIRINGDEVSFPTVSVPGTVDALVMKVNIQNMNMGPRRDILSFIGTRQQYFALPERCNGAVVFPGADKDVVMPILNMQTHSTYPNTYSDALGNKYSPTNMFEYSAKTVVGTCGGLVVFDTRNSGAVRLFGFHTSGVTENSLGFGEAWSREGIESAIGCFDNSDDISYPIDTTQMQANVLIADGQFTSQYKLKVPMAVNYETDLKHSKLAGIFFPPKEMPANLKPRKVDGKIIDPWDINLKKFPKESPVVDPKKVYEICDQLYVDLVQKSQIRVKARKLTMEEACLGEDEYDLGSMPRDTSPGYKYVTKPVPGLPKSQRFFGNSPQGYDIDNEYYKSLEKDVDELIQMFEDGVIPPNIYVADNGKNECLPMEKVLFDEKMRIFNSFEMDHKTVQKMYYGAFQAWITKNRVNNGICIGMNTYKEWDEFAKYLLVFGDEKTKNLRAGDHSRFDMRQIILIMLIIHERIIMRWYKEFGDETAEIDNKVRRTMIWTIICAHKLRIDVTYECNGGCPSGFFLTATLNSLYNLFCIMYVWHKYHDFDIKMLPEFKKHVRPGVLGDDIVAALSMLYNDKITDSYMSEAMKDIGMVYTLETKGEMVDSARAITEVEFLKRSFRRDPYSHRWIGPLRLESMLETVYWTRTRPEADQITRQNVDFVLKELALHGLETFKKYASIIAKESYDKLHYYSDFQNYFVAYEAVMNTDGYF